jgi:SulP family sulfate permease
MPLPTLSRADLLAQARARASRWFGPWVDDVDRETVRIDAQAGLVGALVVLPQAIAFATLAGLPPAWGLYTSIVPCIVAALAGSSRRMVSGPTNATSLALAAMLTPLAAKGSADYLQLAIAVTFGVGMLQTVLGLLRMGALTHFISPSVMLGFTSGAAVLIAWHALGDLLAGVPAMLIALLTFSTAVAGKRWFRGGGQNMLFALIAGTLAAAVLTWAGYDNDQVGRLPATLPELRTPDLEGDDIRRLVSIAFALSIISLGQTVAVGKSMAGRQGELFDPNRETLGQGLSNLVGSFFSCFVSAGSMNRSVVNEQAGARTPLAAILSAVLVMALLLVAGPVLAWIPLAAIAALLLLVAWSLFDRDHWDRVIRLDRTETAIAGGTFFGTLTFSLEVAVLGGVIASLVTYLYRSARPALRTMGFNEPPGRSPNRPFIVIDERPPKALPECPQLKLLRMEGSVYFGAVAHVAEHLHALRLGPDAPKHLLVMSKSMSSIDLAGADLWDAELMRRKAMGGELYFHRPRQQVLDTWRRSGFVDRLGPDHIFDSKPEALATIVPRLDDEVCARCSARIFDECAQRPGAPVAVAAG